MNDRNQNNNPGLPNNSSNDDKNKAQNLSNNYLNSLKPSIGSQTNKWMLNLKEDLSKQLPDLLPSVNSQELKITHDVIANKIFDQLSKYAFEFSKDVANPEFKISTELPSRTTSTARFSFSICVTNNFCKVKLSSAINILGLAKIFGA